ncbi:hypothetical protein K2173_000428 [Erythroxylum novogranatense]|uniref:Uncharacterized protein n=1 Tax=Erythroxylum novogranatense TaxID=1862640 RepID=A0AAV8SW81_9ROSI|nr:hypothetical protein K2173_000428 [Erythroxylum novogranatense]
MWTTMSQFMALDNLQQCGSLKTVLQGYSCRLVKVLLISILCAHGEFQVLTVTEYRTRSCKLHFHLLGGSKEVA